MRGKNPSRNSSYIVKSEENYAHLPNKGYIENSLKYVNSPTKKMPEALYFTVDIARKGCMGASVKIGQRGWHRSYLD